MAMSKIVMTAKNNLYHSLKIGRLNLAHNIFLAPMAGYTDRATRTIALDYGAALAFTEMVSCEGLWRRSDKTQPIMARAEGEENLAIQLFAGNVAALEKSIPFALAQNPQLIDFNCGCPVPKVNKSGSGSALMKDPLLFRQMMRTLRQNVPAEVAVSVKFRSGWDQNQLNYLEIAAIALEEGMDLISLHPRTRKQAYSGWADYSHLKMLKQTFPSAKICGSGDLFTVADVERMLTETEVDAVMLARGTIGNPFIFKQIHNYFTTGVYTEVGAEERVAAALKHFKLALHYNEESLVVREIKKHLLVYPKGVTGSNFFKQKVGPLLDKDAIFKAIYELQESVAKTLT